MNLSKQKFIAGKYFSTWVCVVLESFWAYSMMLHENFLTLSTPICFIYLFCPLGPLCSLSIFFQSKVEWQWDQYQPVLWWPWHIGALALGSPRKRTGRLRRTHPGWYQCSSAHDDRIINVPSWTHLPAFNNSADNNLPLCLVSLSDLSVFTQNTNYPQLTTDTQHSTVRQNTPCSHTAPHHASHGPITITHWPTMVK